METTQTAATPARDDHPIGGRMLRRPLRRAWCLGFSACLLAIIPAVPLSFSAGILLGIAVSVVDLFLMWREIDRAVRFGGGRKRIVRNYFVRYLLLATMLAASMLAGFAAFWGTVLGFLIARGCLVLDGFSSAAGRTAAGGDKE